MAPLLPALMKAGLQPGDRLVFVPDGAMNFLPLHAIPVSESETLGDRYEICYTPSLSVLLQCTRRRRPEPTEMLAAVNPLRDLFYTNVEAKLVRQFFPHSVERSGKDVTHEAFLKESRKCHVCYWTGHAQFSIGIPNWSGLVFRASGEREVQVVKDGQRMTVRRPAPIAPKDIITLTDIDCELEMPECWLAVLSGCQSGLALPGKGNEYVSLIGAFLNAGAKCVVASLWPVEDKVCMLTMDRFFFEWRIEKKGIAAALKAAQHWLKTLTIAKLADYVIDLRKRGVEQVYIAPLEMYVEQQTAAHGKDYCPFTSPFYWAPFIAVGQAWPDAS